MMLLNIFQINTPLEQFEVLPFQVIGSLHFFKIALNFYSNSFVELFENVFAFLIIVTIIVNSNKEFSRNLLLSVCQITQVSLIKSSFIQAKKTFGGFETKAFGLALNLVFLNASGIIPFTTTETAQLLPTSLAALSLFLTFNVYGTLRHKEQFFNLFFPTGSPFNLAFLIIPIEFISYTFRVISISVRLFANMMAGHTLLKVIAGFAFEMLALTGIEIYAILAIVLILIMLSFLEASVALIQSYVFLTLSAMYYTDATFLH